MCRTARSPVTEGNPAYSSRECSVCGCVHKVSRTSRAVFRCKCKTGLHAEVNAARNHQARSSGGVLMFTKAERPSSVL
ncbi:MAG: zinc ribbon domain-containing protein [Thermodesulfovibrionales bacterium]